MNKVAQYLQEHLTGEVMTGADARKYFSTDGSVFAVTPAIIVYPRNENDVRKTTRFTWQLAERGRIIPITARGGGTDQSGAAIGSGIILAFSAHLNKIVEFDSKSGVIATQPGINYGKLQQTVNMHYRFIPPYPSSIEYSTIGGAVANNASGEKTIKYGSTRDYVRGLRVVLANGEVIETKRISKRELNKKLGLSTFEGEIYRALDALLEENSQLVDGLALNVTKNSAGYALNEVKQKNGSFDLTPLFVGSQGTLGIITEVILDTEPLNPNTTLIAASFDDMQLAEEVILELRKLPETPSAMEMIDENLLKFVQKHNPSHITGVIAEPFPKIMLLIELDNPSDRVQRRMVKKVTKLLNKYQVQHTVEHDAAKKEELWKLRHSSAIVMAHTDGNARALPIIEDGIVPVDRFKDYITAVYELFAKHGLQVAVWGHAGDSNLHLQPFLDLSQVGDRQKVFRLIDEYYNLVINLGGSTSGEHNDGRLRGPYLTQLYGADTVTLFKNLKKAFDPYGTLNPGIKAEATLEDAKATLRHEYSLDQLYQHLPRT